MPAKLYLVTRDDLHEGQKVCQIAHAVDHYTRHHTKARDEWTDRGGHVVALQGSPDALYLLRTELQLRGAPFGEFFEADLGYELTALVVPEEHRKLLRKNSFRMIGASKQKAAAADWGASQASPHRPTPTTTR